jgi:homoserine kinase
VRALETGDYGVLREAMKDRWHQPFRAPLVPALSEALALEHPSLLGVCLSGAGPSILALAEDKPEEVATLLGALYDRLGVTRTIRILEAHQPGDS